MLTIITPCSRPSNIKTIFNSINFDLIDKWIIVYDTKNRTRYSKEFPYHTKILEVDCYDPDSYYGNAQRNMGLELANPNTWIYFLDDDNYIHPKFWEIVEMITKTDKEFNYFYTFNQLRGLEQRILFDTM